MIVNAKRLIGLPVFTRSGISVGKVAGFDIDTDTGRIASIRVKTRGLVPGLLDHELAAAWNQVVELTQERVVVEDGAVPIRARALAVRPTATGGDTALASARTGGVHMARQNAGVGGASVAGKHA